MPKPALPPTPEAQDGAPSAATFLVVGIGASAGGLGAAQKFLDAMPAAMGMAFILIQHLDPGHPSMMVDLLAGHTTMTVQQATDGMSLEPDNLYLIPPGTYLSVAKGRLHVSQPTARHGLRLPFDFMLHSLAAGYGRHAACIILSGTGADGSVGLHDIAAQGGLVIAQDPAEADYDGMPQSAILTGAVQAVLKIADIPAALAARRTALASSPDGSSPSRPAPPAQPDDTDPMAAIIELLRTKSGHDFTPYKKGTLQRRVERRMTISGIPKHEHDRYLTLLKNDTSEMTSLANDLLINVTAFFRDTPVFTLLENDIIPKLIHSKTAGQSVRVWVVGCSTGEESYSLGMLLLEAIASFAPTLKVQIFASDVDADAVATARDGLYPTTIETEISVERLDRFFTREEAGWRVKSVLRSAVVFTAHDLLNDPPFSMMDLLSCRNVLIYLRPEAQAQAMARFDFALRDGGILLLGKAETVGPASDRFEIISMSGRVFRHVGNWRRGDVSITFPNGDMLPTSPKASTPPPPSRQAALAELCRRAVLEHHAPASVLVNQRLQCLYFLGPTERYLSLAKGNPSHDLLALTHPIARPQVRAAIQEAIRDDAPTVTRVRRIDAPGDVECFDISVRPLQNGLEKLLLICFIERPAPAQLVLPPGRDGEDRKVLALEDELQNARAELRQALANLESSSQEQTAIHEEALSVSEEYQSTNEELLASKEEQQSLNEELTALNSQLQETLDRQRTTSNDLQNILYSTDVATLFLDAKLHIRFFTPATRAIFNIIPTDIGRPLADLKALANDADLLVDAAKTLIDFTPVTREVETENTSWYLRRVMPYRTHDHGVAGVVITFTDITDRRRADEGLKLAKREAELANLAKSRFLAAASHDLRQPLQTLTLLQGLLMQKLKGHAAASLAALLDPTLSAMTSMLNTLLDLNQIDSGTVQPEVTLFPLGEMLRRLADEFTYLAMAHGLSLRAVPCSLSVRSDPRLLDQILRNLLSNALKYTTHGRILLGCRRHTGCVTIEVWDTGIGIPEHEIDAIFGEYHQLDNAARERSRGLGLGLPIVQRLADLLGHPIRVRSRVGSGSVFAIDVPVALEAGAAETVLIEAAPPVTAATHRDGLVMIIEDDPDVRQAVHLLLVGDGLRTVLAADGATASQLVTQGGARPDLLLVDFSLPGGEDGAKVTTGLRRTLRWNVPAIMLTGDISTDTLRDVAALDCVRLTKPAKPAELLRIVQDLLPAIPRPAPPRTASITRPIIFIADDNRSVRDGLRLVLEAQDMQVEDFESGEAFLAAERPAGPACLLVDAALPGMQGVDLIDRLTAAGDTLPAIVITGESDVAMAVRAMKAGAIDLIEKPVGTADLLMSIQRALAKWHETDESAAWRKQAAAHLAGLTQRQRDVMERVLAGHPSKNIAADLGISQRTVENHRAEIMRRTGSRSLPALARLVMAASQQTTH